MAARPHQTTCPSQNTASTMTIRSVRGSPVSGWLATCGFAKLAGTWLAGLLGLYGFYALITFVRVAPRLPDAYRAIMVLGPSTMACAVLISAATFAGSALRFDLLMTRDSKRRRVSWGQLVLFGVGAYLLAAVGVLAIRSMLPGATDMPPETIAPFPRVLSDLRPLFPVPFGVFPVLSGIAGALVGRITSRSVLAPAAAVPWLACFGLVGAFVASFLGTASLIVQHDLSPMWILVGPLTVPLVVIAALVWHVYSGLGPHGKWTDRDPVSPDTVDEILFRAFESRQTEEDVGVASAGSKDTDVARLVIGMRRAAGSRTKMTDAQVSDIVERLVEHHAGQTRRVIQRRTGRFAAVGEYGSAYTALAAGSLVVGLLGGLPPSISSAAVVGLVGSATVFLATRYRTAVAATE